MFVKLHEPGDYFTYLTAIDGRIEIDAVDSSQYFSYNNGLLGEQKFYELLCCLGGLKLWDVSLNVRGQVQYDFLVIYDSRVFHFDVKNFMGSYSFSDGNFISPQGYVHKDVLSQLNRAHYKLGEFLNGTGYLSQGRIVFINETFSVRGFSGDKNVLFNHQLEDLKRYFDVNYEPSDMDLKIAAMFLDAHCPKEYHRIFYYPFEQMMPGIRCPKCRKIGMKKERNSEYVSCTCGHRLKNKEAVRLAVQEISLLKNGPVKKSEVIQWTGVSQSSVLRMLNELCVKHGTYTNATYTLKRKDK